MTIRMRHTRSHTKNRRSHHKLTDPALTTDKESGVPHLRHRASAVNGKYKGRQVINVEKKAIKEAKKAEAKVEATPKKEAAPKEEKKEKEEK